MNANIAKTTTRKKIKINREVISGSCLVMAEQIVLVQTNETVLEQKCQT